MKANTPWPAHWGHVKVSLVSVSVGILVGIIYGLLLVRSPAPPAIALIGLLGMLIGEQVVPSATKLFKGKPITAAWFVNECAPKITGTSIDPSLPKLDVPKNTAD